VPDQSRGPDTVSELADDEAPEVSVIVPARNEVSTIDRCLDSILSQRGCRMEVVVIDNGSDDGTT